MYNEEEQDIYITHKFLLSIIFDTNNELYKKFEIIKNIDMVGHLKILIEVFTENGIFNKKITDNIYNLLWYLRDIKDEDRNERINLINGITSSLNMQEEDNSLSYYAHQLFVRRNDKYYKQKATVSDIKEEIDLVNESIANDYVILNALSDLVSKEDFEKFCVEEINDNYFFYDSINTFLYECPSLFKNKQFYDKIKYILDVNKNINKSYKKVNKNLIKRMKNINSVKA